MTAPGPIPSRAALLDAERSNEQVGHENQGFLSRSHGLMPVHPPALALPRSHRAWDEVAQELPELARRMEVRATIDELDDLPADPDALPDAALLRAATILGVLAHARHRLDEDQPPGDLPASIRVPWTEVSRRLGRTRPHLSYIDLILHNWRLVDAGRPDPMRVENLRLLVPTVGNQEEQVFYLTQVEMSAQMSPAIEAVVRAQEAAVEHDGPRLSEALHALRQRLDAITYESLPTIDPNQRAETYVDAVTWAKTVAPFGVPFESDIAGPSGTAAPIFSVLDAFFERPSHDTRFGVEVEHLRRWFPIHWRNFLRSLAEVKLRSHLAGNSALQHAYQSTLRAYAGPGGLLERHRLKVYGYLDVAFKVGRDVTIGGFHGVFTDRAWDEVDDELTASADERRAGLPTDRCAARIVDRRALTSDVFEVAIDVLDADLHHAAGDRLEVVVPNPEEVVERTMVALRATDEDEVQLTSQWRATAQELGWRDDTVSVRTLLRHGHLRPVERAVARRLWAVTHDSGLGRVLHARAEDQWELWDLLGHLARGGFDPRHLLRVHPGEPAHLTRVVSPQQPRTYSISSTAEASRPGRLELTVSHLDYASYPLPDEERPRRGTASSFLTSAPLGAELRVLAVRSPRFRLPEDPRRPLLLFAGGAGISPIRSFLRARGAQPDPGPAHLVAAHRTSADVIVGPEVIRGVEDGWLQVEHLITREHAHVTIRDGRVHVTPGPARTVWEAMRSGELQGVVRRQLQAGACVFVCGRAGFSAEVLDGLRQLDPTTDLVAELVASGRLRTEVFTTYPGPIPSTSPRFTASELVQHNDDEHGYHLAIDGRVYDLTRFREIHPGGARIIESYAGMDAGRAFRRVRHHLDAEVQSELTVHHIGTVRRVDFGGRWGTFVGASGLRSITLEELYRRWVRATYTVVEMQNALRNDRSIGERPLTQGAPAGEPSAMLHHLLRGTEQRADRIYRAGAADLVDELWRVTVPVVDPSAPPDPPARAASPSPPRRSSIAEVTRRTARHAAAVAEVKSALRDGLRLFEGFGPDTIARGRDDLRAALSRARQAT